MNDKVQEFTSGWLVARSINSSTHPALLRNGNAADAVSCKVNAQVLPGPWGSYSPERAQLAEIALRLLGFLGDRFLTFPSNLRLPFIC